MQQVPRVLVLLSALCFGTTGTAQALGPEAAPAAVGAARVAVGGSLLALVAWRLVAPSAARWRLGAVLAGAAGVAAYQLTFFAAVADTGVAVGTVVALGSGPVFAGLLGRAVHGETLTRRWTLATGLAVAGVSVLVAAGASASTGSSARPPRPNIRAITASGACPAVRSPLAATVYAA